MLEGKEYWRPDRSQRFLRFRDRLVRASAQGIRGSITRQTFDKIVEVQVMETRPRPIARSANRSRLDRSVEFAGFQD